MMSGLDKVNNALANAKPVSLQEMIEQAAKEFKKVLPIGMRPERLVRIALTCIRQTPELTSCNPESFVGALLVSAQLGLEPVAGRAYILPFYNNKERRRDAQFIVGYKGLADLFYRHDKSVNLAWGVVKKGDNFEYEYGTEAFLRHRPSIKDRGDVVGYYVIAELQGGAKPFMYMSKEDCMAHGKKHSKTFDAKSGQFYSSSPWAKEQDAMCLKTVLIQLSKLLPLSIELNQAIQADETSREYREGLDNALDMPDQAWKDEAIEPTTTTSDSSQKEKERKEMEVVSETVNNIPPIARGTITPPQIKAIQALSTKCFGEFRQEKLAEKIGALGFESLTQLSKENASAMIDELNKLK